MAAWGLVDVLLFVPVDVENHLADLLSLTSVLYLPESLQERRESSAAQLHCPHTCMCTNTSESVCVCVLSVHLHVNEIAPSVSDSNRVRAGDAAFDVCLRTPLGSRLLRLVCVLLCKWRAHVGVGAEVID